MEQGDGAPMNRKVRKYYLDAEAVNAVVMSGNLAAFKIMLALYETWYLDIEHANPVHLTSRSTSKFGLSRGQKSRGLHTLEKLGFVTIIRAGKKNPDVAIHWRLPHVV